jgi:hypothetical protein
MKNFRKKVEVPSTVFMNRTVPVVVVAEWTGTSAFRAFSMESREAMVALHSVGENAWRRRTYGNGAYTGVILVIRGLVIFRTSCIEHITHELLRLRLFVLGTVPW